MTNEADLGPVPGHRLPLSFGKRNDSTGVWGKENGWRSTSAATGMGLS
jgi:anti-sigma-K factor RskA